MAPESSEYIDLIALSSTYPHVPGPEIERTSILDTLDTLYSAPFRTIVMSGDPATGKTTLLRQFVRRAPNDSVHLFMDPKSNYIGSYELALRELSVQLHYVKTGTVLREDSNDPSVIRDLIPRIAQDRRLRKQPLTFVFDGLFDLEPANPALVSQILALLPTNLNSIRFLFSSLPENVSEVKRYLPEVHIQGLTAFTRDETQQLLRDVVDDHEIIGQLHMATGGHVGQLASINRLIREDVPINEIMNAKPKELREYYELEWRTLDLQENDKLVLLSIVVHLPRYLTVEHMSGIMEWTTSSVSEFLSTIPFVTFHKIGNTRYPQIESYPFRRFLEETLVDFRTPAIERALNYLRDLPSSEETIDTIPALLELKGDHKALTEYLTPEVIHTKLTSTQSILSVTEILRTGFEATRRHQDWRKEMYFSLLTSALLDLLSNNTATQQVKYHTAQGEYERALRFARSVFSIENRLLALCKVAGEMSKAGNELSEELLNEIKGYVADVAHIVPDQKALDIATELVRFEQTIAVDLLSNVAGRSGENNAFDWLIARLAQRTLMESDSDAYEQIYESLTDDVSDQTRNRLGILRELFRTSQDSRQLIKQIRELENTEQKVFLARSYLRSEAPWASRTELGAAIVQEILSDGAYSANASVYTDIAKCLRETGSATNESRKLHSLLVAQLPHIKKIGPTSDYYEVQVCVSEYRCRALDLNVDTSLLEIIDELERDRLEPDIELDCAVRILRSIDDLRGECDDHDDLEELINERISQSRDAILSQLAEHASALLPLAHHWFERCSSELFKLTSEMNTQRRKDDIYYQCIKRYGKQFTPSEMTVARVKYLRDVQQRIVNPDLRTAAQTYFGRCVCEAMRADGNGWQSDVEDVKAGLDALVESCIGNAINLADAYDGALHLADLANALEHAGYELTPDLHQSIELGLRSHIAAAETLDGTKSILVDLAEFPSAVLSELDEIGMDQAVSDEIFRTNVLSESLRYIVNLIIRTSKVLLDTERAAAQATIDQLGMIVDQIPGKAERCLIWGHLAALVLEDRNDVSTWIVEKRIWPLYLELKSDGAAGSSNAYNVMKRIAPAIWGTHYSFFESEVRNLGWPRSDSAYHSVLSYLLQGDIIGEPSSVEGYWKKQTYQGALACISIAQNLEDDSLIWWVIYGLLESDRSHKWLRTLNNKQTTDLIRQLNDLIDACLPSRYGVQHNGYEVLARIAIDSRVAGKTVGVAELDTKVSKINNMSDCAFIYTSLIGILPKKRKKQREHCLHQAIELIEKIPSSAERLERARSLIREAIHDFPTITRDKVTKWFRSTLSEGTKDVLVNQRALVDLVYRLDDEWGASLASVADEDRTNGKTRSEVQKIRKYYAAEQSVRQDQWHSPKREEIERYANVFWKALATVNHGRYSQIQQCDERHALHIGSQYELGLVFPIFAFWTASHVERAPAHRRAETTLQLHAVFGDVMETMKRVVNGPIKRRMEIGRQIPVGKSPTSVYAGTGDRDDAMEFLRTWIMQNAEHELIIVDPYFGFDDLEVIRFGQEKKLEMSVVIVAGMGLYEKFEQGTNLRDEFRSKWREAYSSEDSPELTLIIPYITEKRQSPIHDRWILAETGGLHLGTSLSGIGARDSLITVLDGEQFDATREKIVRYIEGRERQRGGYGIRTLSLPLA